MMVVTQEKTECVECPMAKTGKLEWAMAALVAIAFAWIYAGVAWLHWVRARRDTTQENR